MGDIIVKPRMLKSGKIVYEYAFEIASINGQRKRKTKSGFKSKTEAREAGKLAQQAYEHIGQVIEPSEMSYSDFLDEWMEQECKLTCKTSTIEGYEKRIRLYIKPNIGSFRLKAITKSTLQNFIIKMYNEGFSRNTLISIKGLLTKSFDFALDRHYIVSSPATKLIIPINLKPRKTTREKKHVYVPKEMMDKIFERFPEGNSAYIPLMIGYHTGLRLSEIFALVWEDIDFEKKTLSVNRQVQWYATPRTEQQKRETNGTSISDGYWYFTAPKYESYRTIEIDDILLNVLKKEYQRQQRAREYYEEYYKLYYCENKMIYSKTNDIIHDSKISQDVTKHKVNFVCRRDDGSYVSPRSMQHVSSVIHKQLNYPEFDTHSLRHTHGTMLRENGADFIYIKERLGHKNLDTTISIYTDHLSEVSKDAGVGALNSLYSTEE